MEYLWIFLSWKVPTFGELEKGGYYFKIGRTTRITGGICNGTLAYSNWLPADRVRYDENGEVVHITPGITKEYVILSKRPHQSDFCQAEFAEKGDAGSFLINHRGEICGLLYGDTSGFCGQQALYVNAGSVSSMEFVINAIKHRTTGILGLPEEQ